MITLTTDFGLKDPYVAEMKGAILSINPQAQIIDVSHGVDKFSVRMAAFMLASAAPYFPDGTVHVAVVDPGVGTQRRAIAVQTQRAFFVGPDNGVLMLAAQAQGIQRIYEISNPKLMLPTVSCTFHGRDIFAPAAAHLSQGVAIQSFGPELFDPQTPMFTQVECRNGVLGAEVLHVDGFGNVVTNLTRKDLANAASVSVRFHHACLQLPVTRTYADAEPLQAVALFGSSGFLEVALNQGSFHEKYRVNIGDKVEVTPAT
ncbi:MAG: S-adenosyl-l-methionine hydroxide adenosyltransferase family protein [Candidatus Bathyarchaeota archaeon]|nr:S-adenosyl-l-methionine hydroxide adenosyltransferase family protein [Candidatus Bathyarchaeota archaeon]